MIVCAGVSDGNNAKYVLNAGFYYYVLKIVNMKVLHLTLKKKWFDMILSGEKKEEYREIKPYWIKRLCDHSTGTWNQFENITFRNGYSATAPTITIECKGVRVGKPIPEWSDNWLGTVFIIKLGQVLQSAGN